MQYITKKIAAWEIKIGQIRFYGKENILGRDLFKDYLGNTFTLKTFNGSFSEVNFNEKSIRWGFTLACSAFVKHLSVGQVIYMYPGGDNIVIVSEKEPTNDNVTVEQTNNLSQVELLNLVAVLTKENQELRQLNSNLFQYKEQVEKMGNLDPIFNDERFMEDWLERNIHKAIPDLEIIGRQPSVTWPDSKKKNRLDLICLDKTTREFVVVENKVRDNAKNIERQYLSYRAWVKENLNLLNEKYANRNLNATENFKFVIITDKTNEHLERICRSEKITLILIDGGVAFEEIVPYNFE